MAAMFFEICKYPYSLLFPFGQRYCIPNFKLIRPAVYALQFFQSYSRHQVAKLRNFFYLTKELCHK